MYAAFRELRSEMLLRGCHNLSKAQTTIHCYSHAGTNVTASRNLGRIKEDYKALGVQVKSVGVQDIFSSILQLEEKVQPEIDV